MSKYTVFSHKGGVRILADKSAEVPNQTGLPQISNLWEEEESRSPNAAERQSMRQAHSDEAKTVLDLLHSLGVEDDMIMFDNFGG